ncbi:MAG TPA: hypothetical protein PLU76_08460, partial [Treponemataceae bacterium]|nr:hypothetical protein [Treponemataceae bacterium]
PPGYEPDELPTALPCVVCIQDTKIRGKGQWHAWSFLRFFTVFYGWIGNKKPRQVKGGKPCRGSKLNRL